ncbi:hypothetical protein DD594_26740, partial [Enterobacter cloacae complex sp. 4DZ1-17B1]|uniref:hypothetical protein n=1 Tax=Enterobacter cloacae complex sp. 4DZ1-17B1 TaxID=2511991 RepID=UPI001024A6B5
MTQEHTPLGQQDLVKKDQDKKVGKVGNNLEEPPANKDKDKSSNKETTQEQTPLGNKDSNKQEADQENKEPKKTEQIP